MHVLPAEDDDAVLTVPVYLDHGVGAGPFGAADVTDIHIRGTERIEKNLPVFTDHPRVEDFCAGFGQRDGLIQPLPPAKQVLLPGQQGFPGLKNMINLVNMIKINGTVIHDFHGEIPPVLLVF